MDYVENARRKVRKYAKWIPIKKWRHNFRNTVLNALNESTNTILGRYAEMITPTNDKEIQKRILKQNVRLVEIEIASFCNRKCWFCPNSFIDRKSQSVELPESVYLKLIDNLAEVDYSGLLDFHRFNEPLANKDLILKRVRQARIALPHAQLGIFTNGDYSDREYLDALREAGITLMRMSYYFDKNAEFDLDNIKVV